MLSFLARVYGIKHIFTNRNQNFKNQSVANFKTKGCGWNWMLCCNDVCIYTHVYIYILGYIYISIHIHIVLPFTHRICMDLVTNFIILRKKQHQSFGISLDGAAASAEGLSRQKIVNSTSNDHSSFLPFSKIYDGIKTYIYLSIFGWLFNYFLVQSLFSSIFRVL